MITDEQIELAIKEFNVNEVHELMKACSHGWMGGVPSPKKIESTCYSILWNMKTSNAKSVSTGGIHAFYMEYGGGGKELVLLYSPKKVYVTIGEEK